MLTNATQATQANTFQAQLRVDDVEVYVTAPTLPAYLAMLARLGVSTPAAAAAVVKDTKPETVKADKSGKQQAEKTAQATDTKSEAQSSAQTAGEPSHAKTQADASPPAETAKPPAETAKPFEYAQLQQAVFKLAGKSRETAGEVVASFGVKTFKDLDPARWPEAYAAVNEKLTALEMA